MGRDLQEHQKRRQEPKISLTLRYESKRIKVVPKPRSSCPKQFVLTVNKVCRNNVNEKYGSWRVMSQDRNLNEIGGMSAR